MADHELTAAEIAWWATATTAAAPVGPPIYDKYGFETFEDVRDDLTASLRAAGLALELVSVADDSGDYEYRLVDATGGDAGRAFIVHAEEFELPPAPDDYEPARMVVPPGFWDDPPF